MLYSEPGSIRTLRPAHLRNVSLRKRRCWYDDTGSDGEGGDTTTTTETQPEKTGDGGQATQTFTQADVDRIVGERAKRAKDTGVSDFLKELGFEKSDDLKALIKAQREAEEARKSDLDKAQERIAALEKEAADAKAATEQARADARKEKRDAAVIAALKQAEHPGDVMLYIQANKADALGAVMKEDGSIDDKAITKLVADVEAERPSYFKPTAPGSGSHTGGRLPDTSQAQQAARERNLRAKRRHV